MNWFYALDNKQTGPVDDEQFAALVTRGVIRSDTLVWRDGMAGWQAYSTVAPASAAAVPPVTATGGVICSQCGQPFPPDQIMRFGAQWVCAGCKPIYLQRLREGAATVGSGVGPSSPTADLRYAGFWIRFAAKFIDSLILGIPFAVIVFLAVLPVTMRSAGRPPTPEMAFAQLGIQLVAQLLFYVAWGVYSVFFTARYGATPGKMACGLKVVMADGSAIMTGRATGRFFAEILSGMVCYIGYIIAGFDQEKRSLHDHICNTRVIFR